MKKILLVAIATLFIATTAVAQTQFESGKIFAKAGLTGLNFDYVANDFNEMDLGINVGGGYFMMSNLAIRADLGLNMQMAKDVDTDIDIHLQAGARYYVIDNLYAEALLRLDNRSFNDEGNKAIGLGVRAAVGYSLFLNERVSLDPEFGLLIPFNSDNDIQLGLGVAFSVYF